MYYLTGFMGSGKSYTGQRLAALLDLPFIDLDDRIEATAGCSISAIFAAEGEGYFRRMERDELRRTIQEPPSVVATGGGAPCFYRGMEWMNTHGTTVFIDPPLPVLLARLSAGREHRPLLAEADFAADVETRLLARRPVYEQAQIHLRPTDPNADVARLLYVLFASGEDK